ncbi:MAG: hypothetical protein WA793_15415, partial [Sphingorhabdus sp.]|uniref:hypothetical protein n=1 Tax=Sphingorhabdus sp. TaxID=1902408 RepID=UPI003CBDB72F
GGFGQLILTAIAIAVAVLIAGPGAPLLAQIGAAVAGSVVSQGVGVATGLQEKFSFKQVALAGLSAGVSAGLSSLSTVGNSAIAAGTKTAETLSAGAKALRGIGQFLNKGTFLSDVVRGAASSAISQGVATATGLQDRFSWTGVAVGGLVSGVVGAANRGLAKGGIGVAASAITSATERNVGFYANQMLSGMAGAIAGGTARSLANGSSFGDNILATLPDVIGATIGNLVGDAARGRFDSKPLAPDPLNGQNATVAPASAERRYWGIAKPLSNVQYWGGEPDAREISGFSGFEGATLHPMTDPDQPALVVTGQRPNLGQAIYDRLTSTVTAALIYDLVGDVSVADVFTTGKQYVQQAYNRLPPGKEFVGRVTTNLLLGGPSNSVANLYAASMTGRNARAVVDGVGDAFIGAYNSAKMLSNLLPTNVTPEAMQTKAQTAQGISALVNRASSSPLGVSQLGVDMAVAAKGSYDRFQTLDPASKSEALHRLVGQVAGEGTIALLTAGAGAGVQALRGGATVARVGGGVAERATFEIAPASRSLILRPVEIEFPARGLSMTEQRLFSAHLAEQQSTLNRLSIFSPDDLALNLQNYQNIASQIARAKSLARGYLSGSGKGLDAAHALDSVAGGYVNEFAGFRNPVQQRIGALWRTRATQIVPGREHMLTPRFDK